MDIVALYNEYKLIERDTFWLEFYCWQVEVKMDDYDDGLIFQFGWWSIEDIIRRYMQYDATMKGFGIWALVV